MKMIAATLIAALLVSIVRGETTTADTPAGVVSNFIREVGVLATNHSDAIAWYTRMGFTIVGPTVQDIGAGFVMDDYRMEKTIGQPSPISRINMGR
jgi:hypothetical protein